ncbi:hypothetical protein ES702_02805 [subsurface metagenome]
MIELSVEETAPPSLGELLSLHIDSQIKNNFDYSTATARKQDIQNFISANKEKLKPNQLNVKAIRSSFNPMLESKLKIAGKDPEKIMKKNTKLKFNKGLNKSAISPETQKGSNDESPDSKPKLEGVQQGQLGLIQAPAYDEASVSATFSALILPLKIAYPEIELLTDAEKEALGKMWLPAFNLYLADQKYAVIGIPLFATLGIFIPKIVEGRKKHLITKSKEEGQLKMEEISEGSTVRKESEIPETVATPPEIVPNNKPAIGEVVEVLPKQEKKIE